MKGHLRVTISEIPQEVVKKLG